MNVNTPEGISDTKVAASKRRINLKHVANSGLDKSLSKIQKRTVTTAMKLAPVLNPKPNPPGKS